MRGCIMFLLSALSSLISAFSQSNLDGSIELRIENDSLQVSIDYPETEIELSCKNLGNSNLLLYGIVGNVTKIARVDAVCDVEKAGGGLVISIFDMRNERIKPNPGPSESIHSEPMSTERFANLMRQAREEYLSNLKVVKKGEVLLVHERISLKDYGLKRGAYRVQITYFSGRKLLTTRVGEEQVEVDKKLNGAELYQGCAQSNFISLIVN